LPTFSICAFQASFQTFSVVAESIRCRSLLSFGLKSPISSYPALVDFSPHTKGLDQICALVYDYFRYPRFLRPILKLTLTIFLFILTKEARMFSQAILFALIALTFPTAARAQSDVKQAADPARDSLVRLVAQIQRADYEGDRAALKRLHAELTPPSGNEILASRVLYWNGFALWRSAINGFNESPAPKDLEDELNGAIADFDASLAKDPTFVESKIGKVSCLGYVMYLNRKVQTRVQELLLQDRPLLKEVQAQAPDNPRLIWVQGPILWSSPPERGGGQDKAFENYNKGLESVHKQQPGPSDPLEPSWGEP
jgi:hypothetical protein